MSQTSIISFSSIKTNLRLDAEFYKPEFTPEFPRKEVRAGENGVLYADMREKMNSIRKILVRDKKGNRFI
jgi:hypothetical protein